MAAPRSHGGRVGDRKLILAMLVALSAGGCARDKPAPLPPPTVAVAHPLQRDVIDWDDYVGRFEAIQDVQVRPRVSGQVTRIAFRQGVEVKEGQFLFEIDPRPFRAALARAEAEAARAAATLGNARAEYVRARELLQSRAISIEEAEQKQAAERTAQADLEAARAAVKSSALDLEFTTVRAPIAGRVSDKRVSIGDFVTAGQTLLTRIVTVDPIWFSFDGAESFYLKYIRQAESGERPSNPQGLLVPGMFGRARLLGSGAYRAMLVPDEAIITDQTRRFVYVVGRDGKAAVRNVETGPLVEGLRVIKTGLTAADQVALDGLARLQPGAAVKVRMTQITPRAAADNPTSSPLTTPPSVEATAR